MKCQFVHLPIFKTKPSLEKPLAVLMQMNNYKENGTFKKLPAH
jgi:hypothetical protein